MESALENDGDHVMQTPQNVTYRRTTEALAVGGSTLHFSGSSTISTLSVSQTSRSNVDLSSVRASIIDSGDGQSLRYESDEEDSDNCPDDHSAGSTASDFNFLADSTEDALGCRFLVAKQEDNFQAQPEDNQARGVLEKKHRIILQQGLDEGVNIRRVPEEWVTPINDTGAGEPEFSSVDNPGNWPSYVFRPRFKGTKKNRKIWNTLTTRCLLVQGLSQQTLKQVNEL